MDAILGKAFLCESEYSFDRGVRKLGEILILEVCESESQTPPSFD